MRWSFARYLSPEHRLSLLQRRRAQLVEIREGSRRAVESPWRPLDRYQRSLVEHAGEVTEHDLTWIDQLIATERAALPPTPAIAAPEPPAVSAELPRAVPNAPAAGARPVLKVAAKERSEP